MFSYLFEKLFYKKRVVFFKEKCISGQDNGSYFFGGYRFLEEVNKKDIQNIKAGGKKLDFLFRKKESADIKIFGMLSDANELAGYYRAIIPRQKPVFYDNISIEPGEALLCNAYVFESHRRKGLYNFMIKNCHSFLLDITKINRVYTIVEKSNVASLRANKKAGLEKKLENKLYKFFGFNVVSIVIDNDRQKKNITQYCRI